MKKIRSIRTPGIEQNSRFVCIDDFEDEKKCGTYCCGIQVYADYKQKELIKESHLRYGGEIGTFIPIRRWKSDIFELPTITMYMELGSALKRARLIFNKKKGIFIKKKNKAIIYSLTLLNLFKKENNMTQKRKIELQKK